VTKSVTGLNAAPPLVRRIGQGAAGTRDLRAPKGEDLAGGHDRRPSFGHHVSGISTATTVSWGPPRRLTRATGYKLVKRRTAAIDRRKKRRDNRAIWSWDWAPTMENGDGLTVSTKYYFAVLSGTRGEYDLYAPKDEHGGRGHHGLRRREPPSPSLPADTSTTVNWERPATPSRRTASIHAVRASTPQPSTGREST
jgi:hypothetical protein